MNKPFHSLANLYNYINNAKKIDLLESHIASKEEDLKCAEQLEEIYIAIKRAGCEAFVEHTAGTCNKLSKEILKLKLEKNKLEKEMLQFELGILEEE
jgi:adenine-specific DNA methylase